MMDEECKELVEAMNKFDGIQTVESCCGHGEYEYKIWFIARDLECLPELVYYFSPCHCGCYGWNVIATTDCSMRPIIFKVEGPIGAYEDSRKIARAMRE